MTTRLLHYFSASLAALILIGCSTPPHQEPASATRAAGEYRRFSIAPLPAQGPASDPAAASRLNEAARAALVEALTGRGYVEAPPEQADFIVKVETEFSPDPLSEQSEKRHMTIGFHDRASDEEIWSNSRGRSSIRTIEPDLLRKSIFEMLASLPPAPLQK